MILLSRTVVSSVVNDRAAAVANASRVNSSTTLQNRICRPSVVTSTWKSSAHTSSGRVAVTRSPRWCQHCATASRPCANPIADKPEDLTQPRPQTDLHVAGWTWPAALGGTVLTDHRPHATLGDPEPLLQHLHSAAPAVGAHQFPRLRSLSMSMSKAWSATNFFSRGSPAPAPLGRLASSLFIPPY